MSRIKIKNFGPIKEGYTKDDGFIDIKKVTVFIGNQGSGKSTVAKLISTLTWIEKALVRGDLKEKDLTTNNRFLKLIAYQRIDNYIQPNSYIEFLGKAFNLKFEEGKFVSSKLSEVSYQQPKIMYVPAERSFLSIIDRPDKVKNLPQPVYTFNDEYDSAKFLYSKGIELPINGVSFEFDKLNKISHIKNDDNSFNMRLSEASSGYQSLVPLYLVSKYLSDKIQNKIDDESIQEDSLEEQKKIDKQVKAIIDNKELSEDVRLALLKQLSLSLKPTCLINIVEEPELNLFPTSQKRILFSLLEFNKMNEGNVLLMTTHSPYLINYLTLCVKTGMVLNNLKNPEEEQLTKLHAIVPKDATLKAKELAIYEFDEKSGTIQLLADYKGLPSDENYLNNSLDESNELFSQLQEIEKGWR